MKTLAASIYLVILFMFADTVKAQYQNVKNLPVFTCVGQGVFLGYPATISGTLQYHSYDPTGLGDGVSLEFIGTIVTNYGEFPIVYEGYKNLVPFKGWVVTPSGNMRIEVADNTGGKFIIWDGKPTLNARKELGTFVIRWQSQ